MTPDKHCLTLKQTHTEHMEAYVLRLCKLLGRTDAEDILALYWHARGNKYDHDTARTLVLVYMNLIPYEAYLRCYVLSGTSPFTLNYELGSDSAAPLVDVMDSLDITAGDVTPVLTSEPGTIDE